MHREAARAYAKLLDAYPKSKLTPSARLRYALSLLKLAPTKTDEAQRYLESIVDDFPSSPEAKKAALRLAELKKKGRRPSKSRAG